MESVRPDPAFVAIFRNIVETPETTVYNKFVTPPDITVHKRNNWMIGLGVIAAIFSVAAYASSYTKISLGLGALALVSILKSSKTTTVNSPLLGQQFQDIDNFFNPCIEGLNAARRGKAEALCQRLSDLECANEIELIATVKNYSTQYNNKPLDADLFSSVLVAQRIHFQELFLLAQKFSENEFNDFPATFPYYAKIQMKCLRGASIRLVYGLKPDEDKPQPYVNATLENGKAKLVPW